MPSFVRSDAARTQSVVAVEAHELDGMEAGLGHGRVQVPDCGQRLRREALGDHYIAEATRQQLTGEAVPPVEGVSVVRAVGRPTLCCRIPDRGLPVSNRSRRAMRSGEVPNSDSVLEILDGHSP